MADISKTFPYRYVSKEQIDRYMATEGYKKLMKEINRRGLSFDEKTLEKIIINIARDYCSKCDNSKNVWSDIYYLEQNYPFEVSIAQIASYDYAEKFLFIFPAYCKELCINIIKKYNVEYEIREERILNNNVILITICFIYSSKEEEEEKGKLNSTGRKIWQEIEHDNGVRCGLIGWQTYLGIQRDGIIFTNGFRQFGLDKIEPETKIGIRTDLNQLFRSAWEANIARVLDIKNIHWSYEELFFSLKDINYLPDFFLDNNIILEVKGRWDNDSLKKALSFHKEHPEYTYAIIDSDLYYDLDKKYSKIIQNWETTESYPRPNIVSIVGLGFVKDKTVFKNIGVGDKIQLRRDRNNQYDSNAIQALTIEGKPIGFISADWANIYAIKMDIGIEYEAEIIEIQPKVIKVKVSRTNLDTIILYDIFR